MTQKMSMSHFGRLVKERFMDVCNTDETMNIAKFARCINIDRSTVYSLFEQRSPDVHKWKNQVKKYFNQNS